MATSRFWELTEPAVFVQNVAKEHGEFVCVHVIALGVLVSARACFWLAETDSETRRAPQRRFAETRAYFPDCSEVRS